MVTNFGMALAGGGARGAYTAGVLRYLYTELPKHLGFIPWPKIVSGTSVGALNGYFAASHSMLEISRCHDLWTNFQVEDVYHFPFNGLLSLIKDIRSTGSRAALLDPTPLQKLIEREASRRAIRYSIGDGRCSAFIVSATQLHTGKNVLFVDSADKHLNIPPPPQGEIIRTSLYPHHLMASSAIPLVFPPVLVDNIMYVDGGLRQNAPLHPLLHGGADRILVIGTRMMKPLPNNTTDSSFAMIAGKALNALTLDPVERDNLVASKINSIIEWGTANYGPEFARKLEADMGLKPLSIVHLRPSIDLGKLAAQVYKPERIQCSKAMHWFLGRLHQQSEQSGESDLLSHLLFDSCYTAAAEQLGFEDTEKQLDILLAFFNKEE